MSRQERKAKRKAKRKSLFKEFKTFISRGDIMNLAVGIIIGSAFTAIVNSLVKDLLMPLLGLISPKGFAGMYFGLVENGIAEAEVTVGNGIVIPEGGQLYLAYITYGNFIQAVLNFLLIAISVFVIVKIANATAKKIEEAKENIAKLIEKNDEKKAEEVEPIVEQTPVSEPEPVKVDSDEVALLKEIRDLLKKE